ncbi:uracil-DNA glycosylase-like protein [Multifurca ochricompacta]|uniref:Uracil-DNA glycosylase-like protein n=1 Tax=Multifurca ochricompacta TaxID=376703 RepID=A0AAD4QN41_9AGAM|nr:uracil-DNA glycosylase-like protein [Multifurca ochricompacta]
MSAVQGHHYANPTNHFWRCLHLSGFTPRLLLPSEDSTLPEKYNLGLTNLVERPSTSEAELSSQEMASSVPALLARVARLYPRIICFVGKGIWLHVERAFVLSKSKSKTGVTPTFAYGLQPYKAVHDAKASIHETLFYVFPSTSGRVVSHQRNDKVELFKRLKEDLERLKSDTLDTGFMRVIHLSAGAQ